MACEILALLADHFPQPRKHTRIADTVIVHPFFITRVVGRVYIDEIHLPSYSGKSDFKAIGIIAVYCIILTAVERLAAATGSEAVTLCSSS